MKRRPALLCAPYLSLVRHLTLFCCRLNFGLLAEQLGGITLKTKTQLTALIKNARREKASGALDGYTVQADNTSTRSWGPQMRR